MYFQRTLVVSTLVKDANSRSTFFASVYSASALVIIVLQVLATGKLAYSAVLGFMDLQPSQC